MFRSARLQLTAWYVIITMCVSSAFSFVIYRSIMDEVIRFDRVQQARIEKRYEAPFMFSDGSIRYVPIQFSQKSDLVEDVRRRVLILLSIINGVVFILSGMSGYVLSGFTLLPIQRMVKKQHQFISDASHELKTPLTSLKTAFEVFLRDEHPTLADAKSVIAESMQDVNNLQVLSESLLELAQYEHAGQQVFSENIRLERLMTMALRQVHAIAKEKKISITTHADSGSLQGNVKGVLNVCVILLDNAIKYSNEKKSVSFAIHKREREIQISVVDEGAGIASKDMPFIFDRFYRADSARTRTNTSGYGLGLSIAKKIIEAHGGTITVKSRIGKGTTVHVAIPQ